MEKIQERALRFIYEDYASSYEDLLQKWKRTPGDNGLVAHSRFVQRCI
jgi:hypothetical protein